MALAMGPAMVSTAIPPAIAPVIEDTVILVVRDAILAVNQFLRNQLTNNTSNGGTSNASNNVHHLLSDSDPVFKACVYVCYNFVEIGF